MTSRNPCHSSIMFVYRCTQREFVTKESNVKTKSDLFVKITTFATDATPEVKDHTHWKVAYGSFDIGSMRGTLFSNWRANPWPSEQEFQHMDGHQFCEKHIEIVGELADVCAAYTLLDAVDPAFYGQSMHQFELFTKLNRACDKGLARLISCLTCTSGHRHFCHVGDTASAMQARFVPRRRFCWRLRGIKVNIWWHALHFG